MKPAQRHLLVGVAVVAVLALFVALRFRVTTDLYAFLPEADDRALGALSRQIAQSELSRTMILTVTAKTPEEAVAASTDLERALRAEPAVARELSFLEGGPPQGLDRALWDLYEPRRMLFLAATPEEARARLTEDGLTEAAAHLTDELAGPMSPLVARVAPSDPFLVLPGLFERLAKSSSKGPSLRDGRFVTDDPRTAVLFLATRASAFDAEAQGPFLDGITRAFARTNAGHRGELRLEQSGLNRFATRAATAIRGDIQRVGTLSLVLVFVILFAMFRSLRLMALVSIPIGAGVLAGSAAVLLFFGRLHGITVAFGASLIGVSVDYVVHVYCHHAVIGNAHDEDAFDAIGRTLLTGAATTITGFLSLAPSSLSGLREVSCFSATGMVAAFLATRFIVPPLLPRTFRDVPLRTKVVNALTRLLEKLRMHRKLLLVSPIAAVVFVACVIPRARFNDDLASLGRLDPAISAEDAHVRSRVAQVEMMRFVVTKGRTEDEALHASERVQRALTEARDARELDAFRSISTLLPSVRTQRAVGDVVYRDRDLEARFTRVFTRAGFTSDAFTPFLTSLHAPRPQPLEYGTLVRTELRSLVRAFRIELDDGVGFVTLLEGVGDADALARRLHGLPGTIFLRQADLFSEAHVLYQRRTLLQLSLGAAAIFLLLLKRYRSARNTIAVLAPSLLAALVTVSVLTLTGRGIDLVTLTAMLFVVSMGDDYGIFLVDALESTDARQLSAALLGVLIACATTLVGFGLLAFSEHPVLSALGITAASGITASMILSPCTMLLLKSETPA